MVKWKKKKKKFIYIHTNNTFYLITFFILVRKCWSWQQTSPEINLCQLVHVSESSQRRRSSVCTSQLLIFSHPTPRYNIQSDVSRNIFRCCLKHNALCVWNFSLRFGWSLEQSSRSCMAITSWSPAWGESQKAHHSIREWWCTPWQMYHW